MDIRRGFSQPIRLERGVKYACRSNGGGAVQSW